MGYRQMVRHRILIPAFPGSNPGIPVWFSFFEKPPPPSGKLIKGASQVPGGFGNRKYFLALRHSTKNMLLTAEMPLREIA